MGEHTTTLTNCESCGEPFAARTHYITSGLTADAQRLAVPGHVGYRYHLIKPVFLMAWNN